MHRREAIKRTAMIMGTAVSVPAVTGILKGCTPGTDPSWVPEFLTPEEVDLVTVIAERIFPKTDTPGATDVGIPRFTDIMLKDCYPLKDQEIFRAGLTALNEGVKKTTEKSFIDISTEEQDNILSQLDSNPDVKNDRVMAYRTIKELTLLGYFTSEDGIKQNFNYQIVPGRYEGCVTLSPGENPWKGGRL